MCSHDDLLFGGLITIAVSIQVVGALAIAVAINYIYFHKKIKKD